MSFCFVSCYFVLIACLSRVASSPVSLPYRADGDISKVIPDYFDTKIQARTYHNSTPNHDTSAESVIDKDSSCGLRLHVEWSAHVGSPIYSSPVIFPSGSEGKREIFVATFYDEVEVLSSSGHKPWGWPIAFEDSIFMGSPILFDIDADGKDDVGVIDKNGNVFFIRLGEYGQYLEDYHTQIPKLKVKKTWFQGLDEEYVDNYARTSMFDHKTSKHGVVSNKDVPSGATAASANADTASGASGKSRPQGAQADVLSGLKLKVGDISPGKTPEVVKRPTAAGSNDGSASGGSGKKLAGRALLDSTDGRPQRRLLESPPADANVAAAAAASAAADINSVSTDGQEAGDITPEDTPLDTFHNSIATDNDRDSHYMPDPGIPGDFGVPDFGEGFRGRPADPLSPGDRGQHDFDDYMGRMSREYGAEAGTGGAGRGGAGSRWNGPTDDALSFSGSGADDHPSFYYSYGQNANESQWVYVDPHVLASATLADVNGDGHQELIIPVSYYFDKADYESRKDSLDFDISKFVGGAIVCWDLQKQDWAWTAHLDLSTDHTHYKALIKAAPTVVDLDGDGRCEVIIGTDMGLLYVLDGETGFTRRYFPMQFHKIESQIAVADVWGSSDLEIIVADMAGNIVVVSIDGEVIWDRQLSGTLPFTPTVGDVDGDGNLDIVVVAQRKDGCHLWALKGATGHALPGYPIALPHKSAISAPVILVDLHDYADHRYHLDRILSDPHLPAWLKSPREHEAATENIPFIERGALAANRQAQAQARAQEQEEADISLQSQFELNLADAAAAAGVAASLESTGAEALENALKSDSASSEDSSPKRFIRTGRFGPAIDIVGMFLNSSSEGGLGTSYGKQFAEKTRMSQGLHMLVPSFDGHVYIVDGLRGCADSIDIGEHTSTVPLVDDITGDGKLDIIIGTMNGQVVVIGTDVPYHPLNTWSSFPKHRFNGFTHGIVGISIPESAKRALKHADVLVGSTEMSITFDIWDNRYTDDDISSVDSKSESETKDSFNKKKKWLYVVSFSSGSNKALPMLTKEYTKPGRYQVMLPIRPPEAMTLVISMINDHGQYFEEAVAISVGTRFYVWFKYLLVVPVILVSLPIFFIRSPAPATKM